MDKITIEFVGEGICRNNGVGDYFYTPDGNLIIRAYQKSPETFNEAWIIALHELIEQRLTEYKGIKEEDIDAFDRMVDENGGNADEAGNEPNCPYYHEHHIAEVFERLMAELLGINWEDYEKNYVII